MKQQHRHRRARKMVKVASLFSQLLAHFPRTEFAGLVVKHRAERGAKGFTCWTQFVAMLFCQVARADSLREICNGLARCVGKLVHLGVSRAPNKSTLSYANKHRPAAQYEDLFWTVLGRFRTQEMLGAKRHKSRFQNKSLSLDSTTVSLCLAMFRWAKGGVKVHVLLDHTDYMPQYVLITEARWHNRTVLPHLRLAAGSIIVDGRAYNDYKQFARWTDDGVFFVTRMKENAKAKVVRRRKVPKNSNVLRDEIIRLTGVGAPEKCPHLLRRIVVWDEHSACEIVLLTNCQQPQ